MLGGETAGSCIRSCCPTGGDGGGYGGEEGTVALPEELSQWQKEFCASCGGRWAIN
jgi:hypothetical protein